MRNKILILFLIAVNLEPLNATGRRTNFFTNGPGVAAGALAETFTAGGDDVSVIHYNSSLLMTLDRSQVSAIHWFLFDGARYNYVAWAQLLDESVFSMSAAQLYRGGIELRKAIDDTPTTSADSEVAINMAYARQYEPWKLNYGLAVRYLNFSLADYNDTNYGADISLSKKIYEVDKLPRRKMSASAGIQVQNLYSNQLKLKDDAERFPMKTVIGFAGTTSLFSKYNKKADVLSYDTLSLMADFTYFDGSAGVSLGAQYFLMKTVFFRAGWSGANKNMTSGLGFVWHDFQIDYAYLPKEFTTFHKFGFIYKYGNVQGETTPFTSEFQSVYSQAKRLYDQSVRDAQVLQEQGQNQAAADLLVKAIPLLPKENGPARQLLDTCRQAQAAHDIDFYLSSAEILMAQNDFVTANENLVKAIDLRPEDPAVKSAIARAAADKSTDTAARIAEIKDRYVSQSTGSIDKLIARAEFDAAFAVVNKIEAIDRGNVQLSALREKITDGKELYVHEMLMKGDRLAEEKDYGEAYRAYAEAERVKPEAATSVKMKNAQSRFLKKRSFSMKDNLYAEKLYTLAAIAYANDDPQEAKNGLEQLRRFNPAYEFSEMENTLASQGIIDRRK